MKAQPHTAQCDRTKAKNQSTLIYCTVNALCVCFSLIQSAFLIRTSCNVYLLREQVQLCGVVSLTFLWNETFTLHVWINRYISYKYLHFFFFFADFSFILFDVGGCAPEARLLADETGCWSAHQISFHLQSPLTLAVGHRELHLKCTGSTSEAWYCLKWYMLYWRAIVHSSKDSYSKMILER